MMTLKGLKQKIKRLAEGKYHSTRQQITEYHDGEVREEWDAYIAEKGWTPFYPTPEEALAEMKKRCQKGGSNGSS